MFSRGHCRDPESTFFFPTKIPPTKALKVPYCLKHGQLKGSKQSAVKVCSLSRLLCRIQWNILQHCAVTPGFLQHSGKVSSRIGWIMCFDILKKFNFLSLKSSVIYFGSNRSFKTVQPILSTNPKQDKLRNTKDEFWILWKIKCFLQRFMRQWVCLGVLFQIYTSRFLSC